MANKKTIMNKVAKKRGLTTEESRMLVNDVLDAMWESVLEDKILSIYGFGTFNLYIRNSRSVRNPASQKLMEIPEKLQLSFDLALPKRDALYDRKTKQPTNLGEKIMNDIRVVLEADDANKGKDSDETATVLPQKLQKKQLAMMKERVEQNPIKPKWIKDSSQSVVPPTKKPKRYGDVIKEEEND